MRIRVLQVPYDSGLRDRRMGCGPAYLVDQGLPLVLHDSGHTLDVRTVEVDDPHPAEIRMAFQLCAAVSEQVQQCRAEGVFPLVLSGNCNTAVGTISGCGDVDVVWFDAHGEATTPDTTTSGFLDGMPIGILAGHSWRTLAKTIPGFAPVPGERIVLADARDAQPTEEELLAKLGVRRTRSAAECATLLPAGRPIYVHFDLDVLDPGEATTNQWAPPGGWTLAELCGAVRALQERHPIVAAGFASFDPAVDQDGRGRHAVYEIARTLFGIQE